MKKVRRIIGVIMVFVVIVFPREITMLAGNIGEIFGKYLVSVMPY